LGVVDPTQSAALEEEQAGIGKTRRVQPAFLDKGTMVECPALIVAAGVAEPVLPEILEVIKVAEPVVMESHQI
jgi:hypothetical protein